MSTRVESSVLPRAVDLDRLLRVRLEEIEALRRTINTTTQDGSGQRAHQRLPNHLRRRNASHNPYRVPPSLRNAARNEMGNVVDGPKRKPRRRNRRRQDQLLQIEAQEGRAYRWLETHIWHAKRMHMDNQWGYRIAMSPCDKGFRATHKATAHFCTVQDVSYMCCIQFEGYLTSIVATIRPFLANDNTRINSNMYLDGCREGVVDLFERAQWPYLSLGPARFLWKSTEDTVNDSKHRMLWLWLHPSSYPLFKSQCISDDGVLITSLKDRLLRFELRGPRSQLSLRRALRIVDNQINNDDIGTNRMSNTIWRLVSKLSSASCLPIGVVLGLRIENPNGQKLQRIELNPTLSSDDQTLLRSIMLQWPNTFQFSTCRSNLWQDVLTLHPSLEAVSTSDQAEILLIQRPQGLKNTFASGWDLIAPRGWGTTLITSLVFAQARVIGWSNRCQQLFEQGIIVYPDAYVDSNAGWSQIARKNAIAAKEYDAKPKGKRVNYDVTNVENPFCINLEAILNPRGEDSTDDKHCDHSIFLLRNQSLLAHLKQNGYVTINDLTQTYSKLELNHIFRSCLVCVNLECIAKGIAEDRARIYDLNDKLIGVVTHGGYSLVRGRGFALGFITVRHFTLMTSDSSSLSTLQLSQIWNVNVRNLTSSASRRVKLQVARYEISS